MSAQEAKQAASWFDDSMDRAAGWHTRRVRHVLCRWILTALALSLGAAFRFDTVKKLNAVRASGSKPEKARSSGA